MYRNLEAELARNQMTKTKLAEKMGISLGSLSDKLNGRIKLSLREAIEIKKIVGVDMTMEELFEEEQEE